MSNESNRSVNRVEQAIGIASDLIRFKARGSHDHREQGAIIRAVAADCGVCPSGIRSLVQPSRRPKSIDVDFWQRLCDGYAAYLRRELRRLETLGSPDRAVQDLADEAQAVADRIRAALRG